jgi:hypothetical protein
VFVTRENAAIAPGLERHDTGTQPAALRRLSDPAVRHGESCNRPRRYLP